MSYSLCRASLQRYSSPRSCHAQDEIDILLGQDLIATPFQVKCRSQSFFGDISLDLSFDRDDEKADRNLCDVFNELEPARPLPSRVDPDHRHLMGRTTTTINNEQHAEVSSDFSTDDLLGLLSLSVLSSSSDSDSAGRQSLENEASIDDDNLSISPIKWDTEDTEDDVLQAILVEDWENSHKFLSDRAMAPGPLQILPPLDPAPELFSPDLSLRIEQLCSFPNKARVHTNQDSSIFQTSKTPLLPKTTNTSSFASKQHQSFVMRSEKPMSSSRDTNRPSNFPSLKGLLPKTPSSMNTILTGIENDENKKPNPPRSHTNILRAPFPCSPLKRTSPPRQLTANVISNNKHPLRDAPAYQTGTSWSSIKDINQLSHATGSGLRCSPGYNIFGVTTPQVNAHARASFEYIRGDHEQGQRDMWRFEYKGRTAPAASDPHRDDTNEPGEWKLDMSRYAYKGRTSPSASLPQHGDASKPGVCKRDMSRYAYNGRPDPTSVISHGAGYGKGLSHAPGHTEHRQRDMWPSGGRATPSASDSHRGEIIQPGEWKRDEARRKSASTFDPQRGDASKPEECKRDTSRFAYKGGSARTNQKKKNKATVTKVDDLLIVEAIDRPEEHRINLTSRVQAASLGSPGRSRKQSMPLADSLNIAGNKENRQATCNGARRGKAGDVQTLDTGKGHEANVSFQTSPKCMPKNTTPKQQVDTPRPFPIAPRGTAGHDQTLDTGKLHEADLLSRTSPKCTPKNTTPKQRVDTPRPLPIAPRWTACYDQTLNTGKGHDADLLSPRNLKCTPKTKIPQQWVETPDTLPSANRRITRSAIRDGLTPEAVLAYANAASCRVQPSNKKRKSRVLPCSDLSRPIRPSSKKGKVG